MKDFIVAERQLDFATSARGRRGAADRARALRRRTSRACARAPGSAASRSSSRRTGAVEIRQAAAVAPDVLGVNARDLTSFQTDLGALEAMAKEIPPGPVRLAESGIRTRDDIARLAAAGFEAFLVGRDAAARRGSGGELRELRRMTAVKICGLTRAEDVALACALGAAYVGFNFAAASPRRVTPETARELAAAAPAGVLRVGVFVAEDAGTIARAVEARAARPGPAPPPVSRRRRSPASPVPDHRGGAARRARTFAVPRRDLLVRCHAVAPRSERGDREASLDSRAHRGGQLARAGPRGGRARRGERRAR